MSTRLLEISGCWTLGHCPCCFCEKFLCCHNSAQKDCTEGCGHSLCGKWGQSWSGKKQVKTLLFAVHGWILSFWDLIRWVVKMKWQNRMSHGRDAKHVSRTGKSVMLKNVFFQHCQNNASKNLDLPWKENMDWSMMQWSTRAEWWQLWQRLQLDVVSSTRPTEEINLQTELFADWTYAHFHVKIKLRLF